MSSLTYVRTGSTLSPQQQARVLLRESSSHVVDAQGLSMVVSVKVTPRVRVSARQGRHILNAAPADTPEQVIKARTEVTRRIKALGRQGKPKEAINELTSLARMGIQPDVIAATALISACTNNRNMDMAMTVFDELFGDFVEPDDVVFAVLIRGLGQAANPPDWTTVAQLLSRMRKTFNVPMTTAVYNALLELCANSNDVTRAEELMDRMVADGIEPDEYTEGVVEGKRALRAALKRAFA